MDDKFTAAQCLALINGIRDYELLYNPTHKLYKSRPNREIAWIEISNNVGKPAHHCKKKWRHLRDHYIRGGLKRGTTIENWIYYRPLNFLEVVKAKKFPANPVERKAWCESLGFDSESLTGKEVLCSDHFSIHFFSGRSNKRGARLLVGARPQKLSSSNIQRQREIENDDDEDDVFSETDEVQPKRLKTEENETTEIYVNNRAEGLIPVKIVTEEYNAGEINVDDSISNDDTEEFMAEITKRIKRLPPNLKDLAKVNILAHITELELQHSAQYR